MTRRQKAHGSEAPRRRPLARGRIRRALTDPAVFDAHVAMGEALETARELPVRANRRAVEVALRRYSGALRSRPPRTWTARAEARLKVYRRVLLTMPVPVALVTAWAEVPGRSSR